ncbi:MAG: filamentous hemagglutinin N-terminal domain-containing protein, partial [Rhizomicrobium sp.]
MTRFGKTIARSIPAAFLALVVSAFANAASVPTGGAVAVGSATITTPAPNQMVVNQSSNTALINWNSFSISSNASVTFNQPNAASLTVNRVIGPYASIIDGELLANGDIWLINANGILFGEGSEINVGALLATTSDISDDDFRAGKYNFTKASANSAASVINQGTIEAANGGYVVLSGQTVANGGLIEATLGTVVLGGAPAFTIDMTGDKLLSYQIVAPQSGQNNSTAAFVSNAGTIVANGGQVLLTARAAQNVEDNVINNTGIIEATSVSSQNGEIILDAGSNGTVNDSGTLNASGTGAGQTGGTVAITGGTVNVNNGATINASGAAGGGTVEIGGGLHGQGAIADAQTTNVGNATISANAIATGNGGSVTIWSNGTTNFSGSISAQGGAQGGNGGTVETSGGQLNVGLSATVNTEAPKGSTGDWLLDPTDITIQTGGADGVGCGNADCTIAPATITTALNTTDVMLDATSDITVSSEISYSSTNSLTLVSGGTINIDADILNSKSGSLIFNAGGTITIDTSAITTRGTQTFNGPVSLGVDTNLTGSLVDFESTVNDTAAGAQSLTVTGDAEFDGKVGGGEALA